MFVGAPVTNARAAVSEKMCLTYINVCGCFFNLEHFYVPGVDFPPQRIVLLSIVFLFFQKFPVYVFAKETKRTLRPRNVKNQDKYICILRIFIMHQAII